VTVGYLDFHVSGNPLIKTFSVEQMLPIRNARVWIDLGVIDWIEARIGTVPWPKEGQQMNAAEKSSKWSVNH